MLGPPDGKSHYRALVLEQTSVAIDRGELHRQALAEMRRLIALADEALVAMSCSEGKVAERVRALREEMRYPVPTGDEGRQQLLLIAKKGWIGLGWNSSPNSIAFPRRTWKPS